MQILDSLIDGPLQLSDTQEADELIGMIVRWLRTGAEPNPRTDAQRMALAMVAPVIERSRARMLAGSKGGTHKESQPDVTEVTESVNDCDEQTESNEPSKSESNAQSKPSSKTTSKVESKQQSKPLSKTVSKQASKPSSKRPSDIYSSSSSSIPDFQEGESEGETIPYETIVRYLNDAAGTAYRPSSRKTRTLIKSRWNEGFRLADFEKVIDTMVACWGNDERMCAYLRPETLFSPKFESYLNRLKPAGRSISYDVFAAY